jgi:hypothetical protein
MENYKLKKTTKKSHTTKTTTPKVNKTQAEQVMLY